MTYRADIDGLRAVAVLAVVFYHAHLGFPGGFLGVDVFFVISGYLITGIITRDLEAGTFSLSGFFLRRVRRIFPALAVMVSVCIAAGWFLLLPDDFRALMHSVSAQAKLMANVHFWNAAGYFARGAEALPLLHTWSLAVEEQFYLLFPLVLMAAWRFGKRRSTGLIAVLFLLSFGLCWWGSYHAGNAAFFLLPFRAWELLAGSLLALMPHRVNRWPRWLGEVVALTGAALLGWSFCGFNWTSRLPGLGSLVPCGGTILLILAHTGRVTMVSRLLSLRPVVFTGLISYSVYLWHWPVLVFLRYSALAEFPLPARLALVAAGLALGAASWRWIETPFRTRRIFRSNRTLLLLAGILTAGFILTARWVHRGGGMPQSLPAAVLRDYDRFNAARRPAGFHVDLSLREAQGGRFTLLGDPTPEKPALFVWGDSHAMVTAHVLDILCREHHLKGMVATHASMAPLLNVESRHFDGLLADAIPFNDAVLDYIRRNRIREVLMFAVWQNYEKRDPGLIAPALRATVRRLKEARASVYVMKQVPRQFFDVPRALTLGSLRGWNLDELGLLKSEHDPVSRAEDDLMQAAQEEGAVILNPSALFLNKRDRYGVIEGGEALYYDDNHLSTYGALKLRPLFEPLIKDIAGRRE